MSEKYRVIDGFDYKNEPCKLIEYIKTEERYSTENDLEANSLCKLLNEQEERIKELQQTINTIAKDYEQSHGMDIRNAEWFTAW